MYTSKMERILINSPLTIEHLLPQNWVEHWPLPDGRKGISSLDLMLNTDEYEEGIVEACEHREKLLQTVGNLTLMTQPLNSAVSNRPWLDKRKEIIASSILPISVELRTLEKWDEEAILARSDLLFKLGVKIWPGPTRT